MIGNLMGGPFTAKLARMMAQGMVRSNSHLDNFFSEVIRHAEAGQTSFYFSLGGDVLESEEINIIRGLGYSLDWNRSTQWYVVDF